MDLVLLQQGTPPISAYMLCYLPLASVVIGLLVAFVFADRHAARPYARMTPAEGLVEGVKAALPPDQALEVLGRVPEGKVEEILKAGDVATAKPEQGSRPMTPAEGLAEGVKAALPPDQAREVLNRVPDEKAREIIEAGKQMPEQASDPQKAAEQTRVDQPENRQLEGPPSGTPEAAANVVAASTPVGSVPFDPQAAAAATNHPVRIVLVRKDTEVVVLENVSNQPVDLSGWSVKSVRGGQAHRGIGGTLAPGQTREFASGGGRLWNNMAKDDAALYSPDGRIVSYWNDPV